MVIPVPRWRCLSCGRLAEGDEPPDECSECGAAKEDFEEIEEEGE